MPMLLLLALKMVAWFYGLLGMFMAWLRLYL